MSYKIVVANTIDELVALVNGYTKDGYEPIEGFRLVGLCYAQTLFSKKEVKEENIELSLEDTVLFDKLKNNRKELCDKIGAPAYIVSTNRMLDRFIAIKPKNQRRA